ncbi:MAG: OadG family protein [Solobacterium sp.]|nr:OadG family protein [Solobacterium sp.]
MGVGEALMVAVLGFSIVFCMLALIMAMINVISKVTSGMQAKRGTAPAKTAEPAVTKAAEPEVKAGGTYAGEIKLFGVDEKTAACIMAIISDETKIPLNQLIFKSIKAVD